MAEENEDRNTDDLSEEASQSRLEEFRQKGQVSQSKELSTLFLLASTGVAFYLTANSFVKVLADFMKTSFTKHMLFDLKMLPFIWDSCLSASAKAFLPLGMVGFVAGIIASISQIGFIFSFDPITPDLSKVDPLSGIKRVFSFRALFEGLKSLMKISLIGTVAYFLIEKELLKTRSLVDLDVKQIMIYMGTVSFKIFAVLLIFMVAIAALDFFYQRREYNKQLRMTKEEAKQDLKEREGDPLVKSRIRGIQREISRRRMMKAVKTADVVITNPTHFAVAVKYDKDKYMAPVVVAKGADFLAQKIKEAARLNNIPIVENKPLAQTLYKTVKIGRVVPKAMYQAIAEVLAYVYKLKRNKNWI